jgi:DNA-binding transcriptional LysR family regulator
MSDSSDATELRLADLQTFLAVARSTSLAAIARERSVTTSQVSKAISRLEAHFGRELVARSSRGIVVSEAGRELLPKLHDVVRGLENARRMSHGGIELTLGAPSYLQASLVPAMVSADPSLRLSVVELPPSMLRAHAGTYGFELLLLSGALGPLPVGWDAQQVGEIEGGLFASPALAAKLHGGGPIAAETLEDVPFVMPIYFRDGHLTELDDGCPLPRTRRRAGHQVQTILIGLEVAATSDQLVFGPAIVAERFLREGSLVRIDVIGWDVRDPLTLACHGERVSAKTQAVLVRALRRAISP